MAFPHHGVLAHENHGMTSEGTFGSSASVCCRHCQPLRGSTWDIPQAIAEIQRNILKTMKHFWY